MLLLLDEHCKVCMNVIHRVVSDCSCAIRRRRSRRNGKGGIEGFLSSLLASLTSLTWRRLSPGLIHHLGWCTGGSLQATHHHHQQGCSHTRRCHSRSRRHARGQRQSATQPLQRRTRRRSSARPAPANKTPTRLHACRCLGSGNGAGCSWCTSSLCGQEAFQGVVQTPSTPPTRYMRTPPNITHTPPPTHTPRKMHDRSRAAPAQRRGVMTRRWPSSSARCGCTLGAPCCTSSKHRWVGG